MSGDLQHRTSLPSPLPCLLLGTSRLTVVTPSPYRPRPSIVTSSSHRLSVTVLSLTVLSLTVLSLTVLSLTVLSLTVLSSSHRPPVVLSPLFHHCIPPFLLTLLFSYFYGSTFIY